MWKICVRYLLLSFCVVLALVIMSSSAIQAKPKVHYTVVHHSRRCHQQHRRRYSRSSKKHTARHNRRGGVYIARVHHTGACGVTLASRKHWSNRTAYYARRHGIPPAMFLAQIKRESGFRPCAIGPSGAIGIAQIHPRTAKTWKVNTHNPEASLNASAQHMAASIKRYKRKGVSQKRAERLALHQYGTI